MTTWPRPLFKSWRILQCVFSVCLTWANGLQNVQTPHEFSRMNRLEALNKWNAPYAPCGSMRCIGMASHVSRPRSDRSLLQPSANCSKSNFHAHVTPACGTVWPVRSLWKTHLSTATLQGLWHQQALGWRVSKIVTFIEFMLWYGSYMIGCSDLFAAWLCSFDFDMILIWVKSVFSAFLLLCLFFWMSWNDIKILSESHPNRSKSPQDRIKSESKPYQNHIRPIKFLEKAYPMVVSVSFFQANPSGTLRKWLRSQTISNSHPKPYLNHNPDHIQVITKPYQSHNPKFKAYRLSQPYLTIISVISKPYQNKFKKVPS